MSSLTCSSVSSPLLVDFTERWLPQYSHWIERDTYSLQSSLSEWSTIPLRKRSRHPFAKNQKAAGTCARTADRERRELVEPVRRRPHRDVCSVLEHGVGSEETDGVGLR